MRAAFHAPGSPSTVFGHAPGRPVRRDFWENPDFSNHNSFRVAMRLMVGRMRIPASLETAVWALFLRPKMALLACCLRA
jgi:hypothetical protein